MLDDEQERQGQGHQEVAEHGILLAAVGAPTG